MQIVVDMSRAVRYGRRMTDEKKCKSCKEPFEPKQWYQRFCSDKCRQRDVRKRKRKEKLKV